MHASRRAFTAAESSERIRRALRHNVQCYNDVQYVTGDKVFYKRKYSEKWHGAGTVIGQENKQVLVKHGGSYVRVHICRLQKVNQVVHSQKPSQDSEKSPEVTTMQLDNCVSLEDEIFDIDDLESNTTEVPVTEAPVTEDATIDNSQTNGTPIEERSNETSKSETTVNEKKAIPLYFKEFQS